MKKRAAKAKRAAKPSAAKKKSGAKTKKPAAKAVTSTPKATPYTPAALKGDGWPPFRYPLR
jgi:hypothetical protein